VTLRHTLFDQTVDMLVQRFLTQPSLQDLRRRTAEEHYARAVEAMGSEDWATAESEFEQAAAARTAPEYVQGRGLARYHQRQNRCCVDGL
jgi:hypothetical protein